MVYFTTIPEAAPKMTWGQVRQELTEPHFIKGKKKRKSQTASLLSPRSKSRAARLTPAICYFVSFQKYPALSFSQPFAFELDLLIPCPNHYTLPGQHTQRRTENKVVRSVGGKKQTGLHFSTTLEIQNSVPVPTPFLSKHTYLPKEEKKSGREGGEREERERL